MPKMTKANRLLAVKYAVGIFDRAKPVRESKRSGDERALRRAEAKMTKANRLLAVKCIVIMEGV